MNQYKSSSELKNMAREKLSGKYGSSMLVSPILQGVFSFLTVFPLMMIFLLFYIIYIVMYDLEPNFYSILAIVLLITVGCSILVGVLNAGTSLFYLNIACGKRYSVSDIFFGFRWQFKKSIALSAIIQLPSYICLLPYMFFYSMYLFDPQTQWMLGMLASYILAIAIYLPIQLMLSQCYYLLLDFPKASVKDLLKLSIRVMKGHKKRLLYIQLSFIPLELLSACSCNIGSLWLTPYINMTNTLFFLDIMKPNNESASA